MLPSLGVCTETGEVGGHNLFLVLQNTNGEYRGIWENEARSSTSKGYWSRSESEEGTLGMNIH